MRPSSHTDSAAPESSDFPARQLRFHRAEVRLILIIQCMEPVGKYAALVGTSLLCLRSRLRISRYPPQPPRRLSSSFSPRPSAWSSNHEVRDLSSRSKSRIHSTLLCLSPCCRRPCLLLFLSLSSIFPFSLVGEGVAHFAAMWPCPPHL